ncbi:MAG: hypothetical protein WC817_03490 [Patescibacteria group bacterium]|jgi:hypothetical protein
MREKDSQPYSAESEPTQFADALSSVCERHPLFAEKIQQSLEVPQRGAYHREGETMKSHLELVLRTLNDVAQGTFHSTLAPYETLREEMRRVVVTPEGSVSPDMVDYVFLHDIAKMDCLQLKLEGDKNGREVSWEEWQRIAKAGKPFMCDGKAVISIAYFHPSEKSMGQHGNKAAYMLDGQGFSSTMLRAIAKHEVAYQFGKVSAKTYEEHFLKEGFSESEQLYALVASYIDTMGSIREDGNPDLGNFTNLVVSRANLAQLQQAVDGGAVIRENALGYLKKLDHAITEEDIEKASAER